MTNRTRKKNLFRFIPENLYTLVEMLCVVSLILILLCLLLPGVQRVKKHAKIAHWYARNHNLQMNPDVLMYVDFQEKTGTYIENKSGWAKGVTGYQGRDGATANGPVWTQGRWKGKGALLFDGSNDYIGFGNAVYVSQDTNDTATYEAWVCPTSTSSGRHHVISTDNGGFDWSLLREGATWYVFTGENSRSTGLSVDIGQWQHVAAVFAGSAKCRFYKNGQLVSINYIGYDTSYNRTTVACNPGYGEYFAGIIDEAVVYNWALTPKEIEDCYKTGNFN